MIIALYMIIGGVIGFLIPVALCYLDKDPSMGGAYCVMAVMGTTIGAMVAPFIFPFIF